YPHPGRNTDRYELVYTGLLADQAAAEPMRSRVGSGPMSNPSRADVWASGAAYEPYVGRWSRLVARAFLAWLALPTGRRWLDVGCGTGALSQTILETAMPAEVVGI